MDEEDAVVHDCTRGERNARLVRGLVAQAEVHWTRLEDSKHLYQSLGDHCLPTGVGGLW